MTAAPSPLLRALPFVGLTVCVAVSLWCWRAGILTSEDALRSYIAARGAFGALLFIIFQAVQVVVPVLPGGIGCLAGVLMFGPVNGFIYNYIGICAGSLLVFAIARSYGRPLMHRIFSEKTIARYSEWTSDNDRFARLFALAIFLPVAPDDFLCYLAGTTDMKWRQYVPIILLCKPFAIAVYSLGLTFIWQRVVLMLGG